MPLNLHKREKLLILHSRGAKEAEKLTSKVDSLAEQFLRSTGATIQRT